MGFGFFFVISYLSQIGSYKDTSILPAVLLKLTECPVTNKQLERHVDLSRAAAELQAHPRSGPSSAPHRLPSTLSGDVLGAHGRDARKGGDGGGVFLLSRGHRKLKK